MVLAFPRRVALAVAISVAVLAGCTSPEEKKAEHLAAAEEYLEAGQRQEAVLELRGALKLDPKSAEINTRIAEVLEEMGDISNALFFREEAHRLAPESDAAAIALAKLLMFEDAERARGLLEEVIARSPQSVLARVRLSELELVEGDSAGALREALIAVELGPEDFLARVQLGLTRRARVRELQFKKEVVPEAVYQEALEAFERAIEIARANPDIKPEWVQRAWVERANTIATWPQRRKEAYQAYREAAEVMRDHPELELATLLTATQFLRANPDEDMARWILERRIAINPANLESWRLLSGLVDGPDAETATVLERLIAERPTDARAQALYIADLARRVGREAAVAHAEQVAEATDAPEVVYAQVIRIHLQANDVDAASAISEKVAREYPNSGEVDLARGEVALASGDAREAVLAIARSLERRETVEGYRMLAIAQRRLGDDSRALDAITRAIELAPGTGVEQNAMLRQKAQIEMALDDFDSALLTWERIRLSQGKRMSASDAVGLATALYKTGRRGGGRRRLNEVLKLENPPVEAVLLYARMEGPAYPERARRLLEEAAARNPDHPQLAAVLARGDAGSGNLDEALQRLTTALEADPDSVRLRIVRARLYANSGNLEAATADARHAFETAPDERAAGRLLVQLLGAQGKSDEAIEQLEAQREAGKLDAAGDVLLGRLYMARGEHALALERLESALASGGELPGVKNDVAYLLAEEGRDLDRALELAREAREALPGPQPADTLGWVYLKRGLPGPAASQFQEALEMIESNHGAWPTIQYHLGLALKAQGKTEEAARAFEKALAAAVPFPDQDAARQELESLRAAAAGGPS
jgi:tetratricopeptide (TPR) repeat protein